MVNNEERFALRMGDRTVIGDVAIMFRRRSEFLYRASSNLDCQAIRKHDFYEILDKFKEFSFKLKAKAFARYKDIVRLPVLEHKKATHDMIFRLHPHERARMEPVTSDTIGDQLLLLKEMNETGTGIDSDVKHMRRLEESFDALSGIVC